MALLSYVVIKRVIFERLSIRKPNTERRGFGAMDQTEPSRRKYECL